MRLTLFQRECYPVILENCLELTTLPELKEKINEKHGHYIYGIDVQLAIMNLCEVGLLNYIDGSLIYSYPSEDVPKTSQDWIKHLEDWK